MIIIFNRILRSFIIGRVVVIIGRCCKIVLELSANLHLFITKDLLALSYPIVLTLETIIHLHFHKYQLCVLVLPLTWVFRKLIRTFLHKLVLVSLSRDLVMKYDTALAY